MPRHKADKWFLLATALLSGLGLLVMYSASSVLSFQRFDSATHYFWQQVLQGVFPGLFLAWLGYVVPTETWRKLLFPLMVVGVLLLCFVFVPGIGFSAGGASRWISVGPIFFSPAELAKIILVCYLASVVARRPWVLKHFWRGVVPLLVVPLVYAILVISQPDFGTTSVLLVGVASVLFAARLPWRYVLLLSTLAAVIGFAFISLEPYRLERLITFLHPQADPSGSGYQVNQAAIAVGSGGIFGQGYGLSKQKHNFLPEVINDSIFAVAAEELGFVRVVAILLLFVFWVWRGLLIAARSSGFSALLTYGLVSMIAFQTLLNLSSITSLLPFTGVPLPFFSYGGTSLAITLLSCGLIYSASRHG